MSVSINQTNATFLGSEIYRGSTYGAWHPLRIPRVPTVIDLSRALGWLGPGRYVTSPRAKAKALLSFHTPAYIAALQEAERTQSVTGDVRARHCLGTPSNPIFGEMFRRPATAAGASLLAGEMLRHGGIVFSPGSGTHHGMPDRANGFCYLNDVVFALQSLGRNGARRRVYLDIDAHHPDGVVEAFRDDPDVLMISLHEEGRWPGTGSEEDRGQGNIWNLNLPSGAGDDAVALVRDQVILPLISAFRPDAVVLQSGSDGVQEDPQSRLAYSNRAHVDIARALLLLAPRVLITGGGGYNPWSVGRCWTALWAVASGQEIPDRLEGPASDVLSALRWTKGSRQVVPEAHWTNSLLDAPRPGDITADIRAMVQRMTLRARADRAA